MPFNIYEPRNMAKVVQRIPEVTTFLRDTFFKNVEEYPESKIDVDIVKGSRKVAPFVHKTKGGVVIPNTGFTTETYEPQLVAPQRLTTCDDILSRQAGEHLYSGMTPQQRAVKKMADDFAFLDASIARREELMCAQALFQGKIIFKGDAINEELDFGFENFEEIVNESLKWSASATAQPLKDISRGLRKVRETGFVNCDIALLGVDAVEDFLNCESMQKQLDTRNIELAVIDPKVLPNGVTYIGHLKKENISLYSYQGMYLDDWTNPEAPTNKYYLPENYCALLSTQAQYKMLYAGVTLIDEQSKMFNTYAGRRVPETFIKRNPARRFFQLNSKPLPVPAEINSWYVMKVK